MNGGCAHELVHVDAHSACFTSMWLQLISRSPWNLTTVKEEEQEAANTVGGVTSKCLVLICWSSLGSDVSEQTHAIEKRVVLCNWGRSVVIQKLCSGLRRKPRSCSVFH